MPSKPSWFRRLRKITATVEATDSPFFDREALERVFGLKRRQAINLAHELGGYSVGKALLVPRETLVAFLAATGEGQAYQVEEHRRRRVREAVDEARRDLDARRVTFKVPVVASRTIKDLPAGVLVGPGRLEVTGANANDLLQKLFALSRAIASDFRTFEGIVDRG
jgi:hypothetical protein